MSSLNKSRLHELLNWDWACPRQSRFSLSPEMLRARLSPCRSGISWLVT